MLYKDLKKFFLEQELPEDPIKITNAETIINMKLFVDSHISMLDNHPGNKAYLPYYNRLLKLKEILCKDLK